MKEKKLNVPQEAVELTDEQLEDVTGGSATLLKKGFSKIPHPSDEEYSG